MAFDAIVGGDEAAELSQESLDAIEDIVNEAVSSGFLADHVDQADAALDNAWRPVGLTVWSARSRPSMAERSSRVSSL